VAVLPLYTYRRVVKLISLLLLLTSEIYARLPRVLKGVGKFYNKRS